MLPGSRSLPTAPPHFPTSSRRACLTPATQTPWRSLDSTSPLPASELCPASPCGSRVHRSEPPRRAPLLALSKGDPAPFTVPFTRELSDCFVDLFPPPFIIHPQDCRFLEAGIVPPRWPWRTPQLDPAQTHKAGRVVVPHGLGIPEGLQQWVGADDLVFQCPLEQGVRAGRAPCEGELRCPSCPVGPSPAPCFPTQGPTTSSAPHSEPCCQVAFGSGWVS